MAKAKPDTTKTRVAEDVLTDIPIGEIVDPEMIAIETAIRTHGDTGASVTVFRQGPGGYRDLTFLFRCLPSEWLDSGLVRLQSDYGKGTYRLHMQDDSGQMVLNKGIPVEALPRKTDAPVASAASAAVVSTDPAMLMLGELTRSVSALVDAMRVQNSPSSGLQQLKEMAGVMKLMMPSQITQGDPVERAFSMLRTVMDITKSMTPAVARDADGNTDVGGLAMVKGLNLLEQMFTRAIAGNAGGAAEVLPEANPKAITLQTNDGAVILTDEQAADMEMLRIQLRLANAKAKAGASAVEYAESVYELVPDEVLTTLATDTQWFEKLCVAEPKCRPFKEWYETLRARVVAMAVEDGILTADGQPVTVEVTKTTAPANGVAGKSNATTA